MIIEELDFSQLLEMFFSWGGYTTTKVARLSGVPKTTLDTWLAGGTKRPRNGQQIVELCRALELTESDANRLLNSAGHKTIREFHEVALKKNNTKLIDLVGYWLNAVVKSSEIDAPFLAPSRRIDQLFGRDKLVWQIEKVLQDGEYCVLHGMPGVGKTSLAVELAYRVANYFPDGVLWADLSHVGGGDSEEDTERLMACLYTFIRAYGREAQQAVTLESREVLWREVVQNKRALLIFDNVAHTAALQRLLPPDNNHSVVLVTTNNQRVLHGRAQGISVGVLPFEASEALLRHRLGDDGYRIDKEAIGVKEVIELVDGHPLALELVASSVTYITFQEYVRELEDEQTRLDYLADWDDVNKSVKGVFQLSFNRLSEQERYLFAHTALFRGGHFTADAIAYLLDQNIVHAKRSLGRLCQTSFLKIGQLEPDEVRERIGLDRYYVHNLLRVFALYQSRLLDFDFSQLWARLADYYATFASVKSEVQAYDQIDDEWENIYAALEQMVSQKDVDRVYQTVSCLTRYWVGAFGYLDLRGLYVPALNWLSWLYEQVDMPDAVVDTRIANLILRLGVFSFRLNQTAEADRYLSQELPPANLGNEEDVILRQSIAAEALYRIKLDVDKEEAHDLLEQSISDLEQYTSPWARHQRGHLRISLGEVLAKSFGRLEQALNVIESGVADLPDQVTPSHLKGFINSSIVASIMLDRDKGAYYLDQAIVAAKELGDVRFMGLGFLNKAIALRKDGDFAGAKDCYIDAIASFNRIGSQKNVGIAKHNLGRLYMMRGEYEQSYTFLTQALAIAEMHQDVLNMTYANIALGEWSLEQAKLAMAETYLQQALNLCRDGQNVLEMSNALVRLGQVHYLQDEIESALLLIEQGIALAQSKRYLLIEGIGWGQKGVVYEMLDDTLSAEESYQKGVALLQDQDRYELERIQARLDAIQDHRV